MTRKKHQKPVIDRFHSKLMTWKVKTLSFRDRMTLLKVILGSFPTYYFLLFKAPSYIIDELEKIRRRFLWGDLDDGKKIHWISWDKVLALKIEGSLGVVSRNAQKISLILKWLRRPRTKSKSLWCKVVYSLHKLERKSME